MTQPTLEDVRLVGEQVVLRPLLLSDAERAFDTVHKREGILRWLLWSGPAALVDMEDWCRNWAMATDQGWNYHFAICPVGDEERFVGSIGPRFSGHPFLGDVGYWLAEEAWGRGLMSEAVFLCAHLCFRHLEARALTAEVFDGNRGSERVLEKNAFRREPGAHECRLPGGEYQRAWQFSLTRRAFERVLGDRRPLEEHVVLHPAAGSDEPGS